MYTGLDQMINKDLERQLLERKLNFLRNVVIQRGDKIQSLRVLIKKKNITLSDDELLKRIEFLQEQVKYQEFLEKKLVEMIGFIS